MSNFVTIDEDKFEKKTTYTTTTMLKLDMDLFGGDVNLQLRRGVIMPSSDFLVIDISWKGRDGEFLGMKNGKLTIMADNNTIVLPAHENYTKKEYFNSYDHTGTAVESCFYGLSKEDFLKICNCSSVSAKLYTDANNYEINNGNAFAVYCKLFYNAVYDNKAYADVVQNALAEFENAGNSSTFKEIAIDGSGAKASSGCLGMLALLIGMTSAAIGGICALV